MATEALHQCQCEHCRAEESRPEQELHRRMNLFLRRLDEQQRRWYVALESLKIGHGGDRLLSLITGMHVDTVRRGREELADQLEDRPTDRVRVPGGGRKPQKKTTRRSSKIS
jgi:hypothetical protein